MNVLKIRNSLAERGFELTPEECNNMLDFLDFLVQGNQGFYAKLDNMTTEQKIKKIEDLKSAGVSMSLKELNNYITSLKRICILLNLE